MTDRSKVYPGFYVTKSWKTTFFAKSNAPCDHASNNSAKTVIEFPITILRQRLRPQYGDGFRGAPLATSLPVQSLNRRNRGASQNETGTEAEAEGSVPSETGL